VKPQVLFLVALSLLSCACGKTRQAERLLDDVASYIQEAPDSALAAINTIDTLDLRTNRSRAKYSLLYSMAQDKNYIDTTNVSVIMPAIRYYEHHGSADDKLKSLYYLGRVQYNAGDYYEAIVSFTKALQYTGSAKDIKYIEMLYTIIALTYRNNYNHEEALPFFIKAYDCIKSIPGLESNKLNTLFNLGSAYYSTGKFDEAEKVYNSLLKSDGLSEQMKGKIYGELAFIKVNTDSRDKFAAVQLFEDALASRAQLGRNQWAAYAYALSLAGQTDKSDAIFNKLSASKDSAKIASACYWRSFAEEKRNDFKSAFADYRWAMEYKNKTLRRALYQSTARAQRDYFEAQGINEKNHIRTQRLFFIIILMILIIAALGVTLLFALRNQTLLKERNSIAEIASVAKIQMQEAERHAETLMEQLDEKDKAIYGLKAEYAKMYKDKFSYLARLCESYYNSNDYIEPDKRVYRQVKRMVDEIGNDKKGQQHFEKMINRDLDNIMLHFREDFPKYGEEDYRFVSYVFIGFDSVTLMAIFQMPSSASVYMKKSRIKRAIQESSSKYKPYYLQMFL
jgi:cytochrome c-type biogenesis protein CcmH/NrfG